MKTAVVVCIFGFAVALVHAARLPRDNKYTTKYDNVDLDNILASERLLQNYANCLLDKGPCTPDGVELKSNLPDALHNGCGKCSEKQKGGAEKVVHFLIKNKPDLWRELEAKYDPDGSYRKKYEKEYKDITS